MMHYRGLFYAAMLIAALALSACGGDDPEPVTTPVPAVEEPAATVEEPAPAVEAEAETEPIDDELQQASAIRATTLIGLDVEDANGEYVGNIDDAFVIVANGEVQYAVITPGGLEGMVADWMLPIPVSAMTVSAERNSVIIGSDATQLTEAPGFETDAWPDLTDVDWDLGIRSFWADMTDDADPTATPVAEEEPVAEEADATPTAMSEEEALEEVMDDDADTEMSETGAVTDTEEMDAEATAMPAEEMDSDEATDEQAIRVPYALSMNTLLDFEIHDPFGENLGNVEDMVIDWDSGEIQYVVLSFGGFLGLGENWFAFPWGELVFDPLENAFITSVTEEALSDAPGFDGDNWPDFNDPTWDSQFQEFWQAD